MRSRIQLSPLSKKDIAPLASLFSDTEAYRFLGGPSSPEAATLKAAEWVDTASQKTIWSINPSDHSEFLGFISLTPHHDGIDTVFSYALLPKLWGNGYATDAMQLALQYAFKDLQLEKVIAETQEKNLTSTRLLERVHMSPEKHLIRFGERQVVYSITRSHWKTIYTDL